MATPLVAAGNLALEARPLYGCAVPAADTGASNALLDWPTDMPRGEAWASSRLATPFLCGEYVAPGDSGDDTGPHPLLRPLLLLLLLPPSAAAPCDDSEGVRPAVPPSAARWAGGSSSPVLRRRRRVARRFTAGAPLSPGPRLPARDLFTAAPGLLGWMPASGGSSLAPLGFADPASVPPDEPSA